MLLLCVKSKLHAVYQLIITSSCVPDVSWTICSKKRVHYSGRGQCHSPSAESTLVSYQHISFLSGLLPKTVIIGLCGRTTWGFFFSSAWQISLFQSSEEGTIPSTTFPLWFKHIKTCSKGKERERDWERLSMASLRNVYKALTAHAVCSLCQMNETSSNITV